VAGKQWLSVVRGARALRIEGLLRAQGGKTDARELVASAQVVLL
jgi:hypothetical protein